MKILAVCQYYWPEPFSTADICEGLVERGHEVTVLTGMPNYGMPNDDIPDAYRGKKRLEETRNGVHIVRAPLSPRKSGALNRIKNYISFWQSGIKCVPFLDNDFDVVLGLQFSPVMQVDPGIAYARRRDKKVLLYCFDLWPASLLAGGFKESSLPFKWMKAVSKRIYSDADRIAVTSPLFDKYFRDDLNLNIPDSAYLPQYAEDLFSVNADPIVEGFDPLKTNLTFAGNIGQAQSVITIVEAAAYLKGNNQIVFHVVGSGSRLDDCEKRARDLGLNNIIFHGRKPVEEMPSYYAASDAMIVTFESSPMATYTLPRKVTTYLAAGKPVLAALEGETERVIDEAQCGLTCGIEDAEGLAEISLRFSNMDNPDELGCRARAYYETHFTKDKFFSTLEGLLKELAEVR